MFQVKKVSILALVMLGLFSAASAQIEGVWFNNEKDAKIQIYKATDGKFYGKIVWLKEPLKNGKPKVDENNRKTSLQTQPLISLVILKGFQKSGNSYTEGTIYDPENGKVYDCKMTLNGNSLSIRGYIGFSLIGRTTIWERAS